MIHEFNHLVGNKSAISALKTLATTKKLPQVLLFCGPDGVGKKKAAYAFISQLIDKTGAQGHQLETHSHSDVKEYFPETKAESYSVATIDHFIEEAAYPPFESEYRFFLFYQAEALLTVHANRLLKTLEEMPDQSIVILFASNKSQVLDTIVSRCRAISFFPIAPKDIEIFLMDQFGLEQEVAARYALRAQGSLKEAIELHEGQTIDDIVVQAHTAFAQRQVDLGFEKLDEIADLIEAQSEEKKSRKKLFERVLQSALFWVRDLHLARESQSIEFYHYPEKKELFSRLIDRKIPTLTDVKKYQLNAIEGFERHLRPKTILHQYLIRTHSLA